MDEQDRELLLLMGSSGESRVYHADGRPYGPSNTERSTKMKDTKRRIAELEAKVAELKGELAGGEDVELAWNVQPVHQPSETDTAENEHTGLGWNVQPVHQPDN